MRSTRWMVAGAAIALVTAGCGSQIEVRTMARPDASLSALHSFRMMPGPARRDGRATTGADDPMINNSIANRAISDRLTKAFQDRGYTFDVRGADFGVAFYATAREKLDASLWDYGYPFDTDWYRFPRAPQTLVPYTEGTVIVDVVSIATRELLWRGEGKAVLSDNPGESVQQLARAAEAIVARFPHATPRVVATRN
jgi:hypothetical protein